MVINEKKQPAWIDDTIINELLIEVAERFLTGFVHPSYGAPVGLIEVFRDSALEGRELAVYACVRLDIRVDDRNNRPRIGDIQEAIASVCMPCDDSEAIYRGLAQRLGAITWPMNGVA